MKIKNVFLLTTLAMGAASMSVHAADAGSGRVNFEGKIIEAPCTVAPESTEIPVNLGQVSNKVLANGGHSQTEVFEIKLLDCDTTAQKNVTVTFGGMPDMTDTTLLGLLGSASGAGVALLDSSGAQIPVGGNSSAQKLTDGTNVLRFGAYLKGTPGNGSGVPVVPGDFTSVANFALAYN